jgi:NADH:ubiquinone oxidoreductase subunit C
MDINTLINVLGECEFVNNKIYINSDNIRKALTYLKENFSYNLLKSITAVDNGDSIELNYNLFSVINEESVIIAIRVKYEAQSIADIFASAQADENEIYDMFGVMFIGNEDLKRLYMPENWNGYPLRKDYIQDDTRLAWNDIDEHNT